MRAGVSGSRHDGSEQCCDLSSLDLIKVVWVEDIYECGPRQARLWIGFVKLLYAVPPYQCLYFSRAVTSLPHHLMTTADLRVV